MRAKMLCAMVVIVGLVLGSAVTGSYAGDEGKGKEGCLAGKLCMKMAFVMANEKDLGLTEEQVAKLKELNMKTKKEMIGMKASEEIAELDMGEALHQKTIDVAAVNALIDKEFDLKKGKAKAMVASYAALKDILTTEQKDKMKELWKAGEKREGHDNRDNKMCDMTKCHKCCEKMSSK